MSPAQRRRVYQPAAATVTGNAAPAGAGAHTPGSSRVTATEVLQ